MARCVSCALYLVHQNIGYGVIRWSYEAGLPGWSGSAIALGTSLMLAEAIHQWVERPALEWFGKKRRDALPKAEAVTPA